MMQEIHADFKSLGSLLFILGCFIGFLVWLSYMAITQRKMIKHMVTRKEFTKAFDDFRKEMQGQ